MNKYGDEQHDSQQSHGDRHLDAQASIIHNSQFHSDYSKIFVGVANHRDILVYNELFTFSDANAHEIIQSPEEFLHFWICFDVDVVSTYKTWIKFEYYGFALTYNNI